MGRNKEVPNRYNTLLECVSRRERLAESGKFSLPVDQGYPVILTSGKTDEEIRVLIEHAEALAEDPTRGFFRATRIIQAREEDVKDYLLDPEATSLALIGDGNFGTFHMAVPGQDYFERVTWDSLGRTATHLKTGVFEQRTCTRRLNAETEVRVSLGSFIMADQSRIVSSVDKVFATHHGFEVFNQFMHPVYPRAHNDAEQLRHPIDLSRILN